MFCPKCGSSQADDLRFCKQCGSNLAAVRTAVAKPEAVEGFDWSKTWVAEMFMSSDESVRRAAEIERIRGLTPELKRQNEIKGGVITASVGVGLMVVLSVLMEAIVISGRVSDIAADILSRVWIVGLIPVLVGAALIFNGLFISKRSAKTIAPEPTGEGETTRLPSPASPDFLPPADTNELFPAGFSVTDETTKHLKTPRQN